MNYQVTFKNGEIHMLCANSADEARKLTEAPHDPVAKVEQVSDKRFGAWLSDRTPANFGEDEQDMTPDRNAFDAE